jgi:hypothetical protein
VQLGTSSKRFDPVGQLERLGRGRRIGGPFRSGHGAWSMRFFLVLMGSLAPPRAHAITYTAADAKACLSDAVRLCSSEIPN